MSWFLALSVYLWRMYWPCKITGFHNKVFQVLIFSHGFEMIKCKDNRIQSMSFAPRDYIVKPQKLIFCVLMAENCIYNRIHSGPCDRTGHQQMAALGMVGDHDDNPCKILHKTFFWRSQAVLPNANPTLCHIMCWVSQFSIYFNQNRISNFSWISDC